MNSTEKTFLLTGGTGAIGKGIASLIVADNNNRLVLLARNPDKAVSTVEELKKGSGNPNISFLIADLSIKSEIQKVADKWTGPLNILINNAAITPRQRIETADGIELQFATNVLAYFWMIQSFAPILKQSKSSRIVNVASYWAGGLYLADLEFKQRQYDNDTAYRQSKQANRMLTVSFAKLLKADGITVNACHPGDVNSFLSNQLGYGGHESPEQGAATPVWLATSKELEKITGGYFEHLKQRICQFGHDQQSIDRLFEICESY